MGGRDAQREGRILTVAKAKTDGRKAERNALTLTPKIIEEAARIVGKGNFRYVARGRLGIPQETWKSWLYRGRTEWREYTRGDREKITLKMELVKALDQAECRNHSDIIEDVMSDETPIKIKMEYLYRRYGKLYSKSPNAVDDDTGEDVKVDPNQVLIEKLSAFLPEGKGEPEDD